MREESIGKSGDGPSAKTGFWNLRGFASHLSLDSETAQLKNMTWKDIHFVLKDLTSDTH